jgi:hypothetical protein
VSPVEVYGKFIQCVHVSPCSDVPTIGVPGCGWTLIYPGYQVANAAAVGDIRLCTYLIRLFRNQEGRRRGCSIACNSAAIDGAVRNAGAVLPYGEILVWAGSDGNFLEKPFH